MLNKQPIEKEKEEKEEYEESLEEKPSFFELNEAKQKATKEV